ncbi:hypothetical protein ACT7V1_001236 [Salmonella enterica subsp. enterica]
MISITIVVAAVGTAETGMFCFDNGCEHTHSNRHRCNTSHASPETMAMVET